MDFGFCVDKGDFPGPITCTINNMCLTLQCVLTFMCSQQLATLYGIDENTQENRPMEDNSKHHENKKG